MKKVLSAILILALALALFGCQAGGSGGAVSNPKDFGYEETDGGLTITQYLGTASNVVIPSVIDNKKVIGLSDTAFSGNIALKEITLPDTYHAFFFDCFKNCDSLEKIVYQGAIGDDAYLNTKALEKLPALKTLEFATIENKYLAHGLGGILSASKTLDTVIIHSAAEFEDTNVWLGETLSILHVDRDVEITLPEEIVSLYMDKTAYVQYNRTLWDDSEWEPWGEVLCSELISSGEKYSPSEDLKERIASALTNSGITASDWYLIEEDSDDEYMDVYTIVANAEVDGMSGVYTAIVNDFENVFEPGVYNTYCDAEYFYERLESSANMCIVFRLDKLTVNGVQYQMPN